VRCKVLDERRRSSYIQRAWHMNRRPLAPSVATAMSTELPQVGYRKLHSFL